MRALRRATLSAERAIEQNGRPRWLQRVRRALHRAGRRILADRDGNFIPCRAAVQTLVSRANGLVDELLPRAAALETSAKIAPRLTAAIAAAAPTDRIRVYVGIREPRRPDGVIVPFESVVEHARTPVIPGVLYANIVSAEVSHPLAHALRVAGCEDISALWLIPAIYADCTPAAIQEAAKRSGVVEIDLDSFL
jgi:hypothetical protein